MLKNRVFYITLLIITVLMHIMKESYGTLMMLILVIGLPLFSLGFLILGRKKVEVSISAPFSVEKNASSFLEYVVKSDTFFPLGFISFVIDIENQLTYIKARKNVYISLNAKREERIDLKVVDGQIGTLAIRINNIKIYDLFGMFRFKFNLDVKKETTILYQDRSVSVYTKEPIETMGESEKHSQDKQGNDVSELFAIREYIPGDEIRRIHWKLSSKTDKIIVKEFGFPLNYSIVLLLDIDSSRSDDIEKTVEIFFSASKALLELGMNHTLAFLDAGNERITIEEIESIEDFQFTTFKILQGGIYSSEGGSLDYYLAGGHANPRATLVYISPLENEERLEELSILQRVIRVDTLKEEANIEIVI